MRPRFKQPPTAAPEPFLPPSVHKTARSEPSAVRNAARAKRENHPQADLFRLRAEAAAEVERLLTFLDETDGDPDLEANDAEPSDFEIAETIRKHAALIDLEDDEDGADHEPSLGLSEPVLTGDERPGFPWPYYSHDAAQARPLALACTDDRENDGSDLEPSLCGVTAQAFPSIGAGVEDGEDNDDDHDDDLEREPSLGWTPQEAAGGSFYCGIADIGRVDVEEQCEDEGDHSDSGIGDLEGLLEQCTGFTLPYNGWVVL